MCLKNHSPNHVNSSEPPMADADDFLMDLLTYTCPVSGVSRTVVMKQDSPGDLVLKHVKPNQKIK